MRPKLSSVKDTLLAFPTPIHQARYDNVGELNDEVARRILALRAKSPGVQKSNLGGWHGEATLLQDLGEPYGSRLGRMFVESIQTLLGNLCDIVAGPLSVQSGGKIDFSTAGAFLQQLTLSDSPSLAGTIRMRFLPAGMTNDSISVPTAGLTYGGSLVLTQQLGAPPANGSSFKLFNAASYGGAFSSISLPQLSAGLMWTNQLLLNGSIAIVPQVQPSINGLVKSGTNLVFTVSGGTPGGAYTLLTSTNVALPLSTWSTNSTGNFDWMGNITLTNGINPDEAQRYFNVRVP